MFSINRPWGTMAIKIVKQTPMIFLNALHREREEWFANYVKMFSIFKHFFS
jgi:hypothetical protein